MSKRLNQAVENAEKYNRKVYQMPDDLKTRDEIEVYYHKIAKLADQRLVRIEAYSHDEHFKGIKTFAYARALKDISTYSGEGAKRFNTAAPKNLNTLNAKIQDILTFINSPTSTKQGIISTYKKRANTINERYGTDFTWKELATYYERGINNKLAAKGFESKSAFIAIAKVKDNADTLVDDIKEAVGTDIREDDKKVTNDLIFKYLAEADIKKSEIMRLKKKGK